MDGNDSSGFGVNLIAYIRAEMGLGSAARGLAMAMDSADIPFNVINFEHSNPGQHRDNSWRHKESDHSSYDFTVLAVNPDNLSNAMARAQRELVRDRYTIGYWFWELPEIPDAWLPSLSLVDEVWAASRFVQDAISLKSPVPVFRVPVPVRLGSTDTFSRRNFGLPQRQFLFLSISDTHSELARKNPLGAVHAFKKAFPGDNKRVGLVLKISNVDSVHADHETMDQIREEIAGHRNIYLLDRNMGREEIDALLELSDCFISLHRSEGFGLGPAEAMSLGKPVILTNWSGNVDYMTPQNSIGISYELVALGRQYGPYPATQIWAEPDLEEAASWMKRLAKDSALATQIGRLGQRTITKQFSPEAVGKLVHERLSSLHATGLASRMIRVEERNGDNVVAGEVSAIVATPARAESACLTVYAASHSGYSEEGSLDIPYETQRWSHMHIALEHGLGVKQLRVDPMKGPGLIDIAGVAIKSAIGGEVLWRANGRAGGLESLETGGSALRVPHPRLARVFSYGEDPQVLLPLLSGADFDGPLRLEIWLKTETRPEPIREAMAELNAQSAQARAQIAGSHLLLEQKERDWAAKDQELEGLREMLTVRDHEVRETREQITALKEELDHADRQLNSNQKALAQSNSEIERRQQELVSLKGKVAAAVAERDRVQQELSLLKKNSALHETALEEASRLTVSAQNELAAKRDEVDELVRELGMTTHELTRVAAEIGVLKRRLLDQQRLINDLRERPFWRALNAFPTLQRFVKGKAPADLGQNDPAVPEEPKEIFWLEHPAGPSKEGETIIVSGWVVTPSGERIEGVEARVNGEVVTGVHGLERGDVGAFHKERSDYLNSGFVIDLILPAGSHHVSLQYLTRSQGWTDFCSFQHEVYAGSELADPGSHPAHSG
jgi:glycosyltransferase involved in cell wall biosynthesis